MALSPAQAASTLSSIFENLWLDYAAFNPRAKRVHDLILERERTLDPAISSLVNDHVALRTFNLPKIGIDALARHFIRCGYEAKGEYVFEAKKLYARHFEHPDASMPKVFISELRVELCSPLVRMVAEEAVRSTPDALLEREDFLWSRRTWKASHAIYKQLLEESEYAAWLYAFGFRSNHFTISFNQLKSFAELRDLNAFVKENGYRLNGSGGEIKGAPQELLEQSSTLAESARVMFEDGEVEIPSCYYEFARRYAMPDGRLYQGFIAASADRIFESTDVKAPQGVAGAERSGSEIDGSEIGA
jgi:hypothetical protein